MAVTSKSSTLTVTPRGALRNISNNATPTSLFGLSPSYRNGPSGVLKGSPSIRTPSGKLATSNDPFSNERKISTSHGDLSCIRPKSPPLPVVTPGSKDSRRLFPPFSSPESPWIPTHPKEPAKTPRYEDGSQLNSARLRSPLRSFPVAPEVNDPWHISLVGLKASYKSPVDIYMPIVQMRKPSVEPHPGQILDNLRRRPVIEQLDVTTVWSNLSIGIAEMLFEMNRVIGPCLESMLATRLETLDIAARQEYSPFKGNLSGELNETHPLFFSLGDLIDSMLEKMHFRCYHHMSLQSPDILLDLMMLYLISLNNIDEYHGPATADAVIHVGLRPGSDILSDVVPPPTAHVVQQLDYLSFPSLDVMPREGTTIIIVPQYSRGVFHKTSESYSEVSYAMESKPSWLEWNDGISGWKGNLPLYSEWRGKSKNSEEVISGGRVGPYAVVNLLRLEVKAVLIERHSSASVRLKRTLRARLTIKVIPWYAHENLYASHGHPQRQKAKMGTYNDDWLSSSPPLLPKPDLSPTLRGRYNDNRFGLGNDKAVFDTVSLQDVEAYCLAGPHLNCSSSALHKIRSENMHEVHQNRTPPSDSSMLSASEELESWSTREAARIPRCSDLKMSGNGFADDPILTRDASSRTSSSSDLSQSISSGQNQENWSPEDCSLDTGDKNHPSIHNATEKRCGNSVGEAAQAALDGIQFNGGQTQAEDDEWHWQDSAEFDSEFFDEHDRHARRHSLHNASSELFGLAELLHETRSRMEEGCAMQSVGCESPSPVEFTPLGVRGYEDENEATSESNLHKASTVMFLLNRYPALLDLGEQASHQSLTPEQLPTPDFERMETGPPFQRG